MWVDDKKQLVATRCESFRCRAVFHTRSEKLMFVQRRRHTLSDGCQIQENGTRGPVRRPGRRAPLDPAYQEVRASGYNPSCYERQGDDLPCTVDKRSSLGPSWASSPCSTAKVAGETVLTAYLGTSILALGPTPCRVLTGLGLGLSDTPNPSTRSARYRRATPMPSPLS